MQPKIEEQIPADDNQPGPGAAEPRSAGEQNTSSRAMICQVPGCGADVSQLKEYFRRYRICFEHSRLAIIKLHGEDCRWCQQCGRFQLLSEFTASNRTCTMRLAKHNERRLQRKAKLRSHGGLLGAAGSGGSQELPPAVTAAAVKHPGALNGHALTGNKSARSPNKGGAADGIGVVRVPDVKPSGLATRSQPVVAEHGDEGSESPTTPVLQHQSSAPQPACEPAPLSQSDSPSSKRTKLSEGHVHVHPGISIVPPIRHGSANMASVISSSSAQAAVGASGPPPAVAHIQVGYTPPFVPAIAPKPIAPTQEARQAGKEQKGLEGGPLRSVFHQQVGQGDEEEDETMADNPGASAGVKPAPEGNDNLQHQQLQERSSQPQQTQVQVQGQPVLQERTSQTQQVHTEQQLPQQQQQQQLLVSDALNPVLAGAGVVGQTQHILLQHPQQPQAATSQQQVSHQQGGHEQQQQQQHQHIVVSQLSGIPAGSLLRALANAGHNFVVQQPTQQAQQQQQQQVPKQVQIHHLQQLQQQQQQQQQQVYYQQPQQQHIILQQDMGPVPGGFTQPQGNYTFVNAGASQHGAGGPQIITSGFTLGGAPLPGSNGSNMGSAVAHTISLPNGTIMASNAGALMGNTIGGQFVSSSGQATSMHAAHQQQQGVVQYPTVIQNQDGMQLVFIPGGPQFQGTQQLQGAQQFSGVPHLPGAQHSAGPSGHTWSLVQQVGMADGMQGQHHSAPAMPMSANTLQGIVQQQTTLPGAAMNPFTQQSHLHSPTLQAVPQQQPFHPQHQHIVINGPSGGGFSTGGVVSQGALLQPGQFMYGTQAALSEQAAGNNGAGAIQLNTLNLANAGGPGNAALVASLLQQQVTGAPGHMSHIAGANNITLGKPDQEAGLGTRLSNQSDVSLPSFPSITVTPAHRELAMRLSLNAPRGPGAGVGAPQSGIAGLPGGIALAPSPLVDSLLLPQLQKQGVYVSNPAAGMGDLPAGVGGSGSSWLQQFTEERALCSRLSDSLLLTFGGQPLAPTAAALPM